MWTTHRRKKYAMYLLLKKTLYFLYRLNKIKNPNVYHYRSFFLLNNNDSGEIAISRTFLSSKHHDCFSFSLSLCRRVCVCVCACKFESSVMFLFSFTSRWIYNISKFPEWYLKEPLTSLQQRLLTYEMTIRI